ISVIFFLNGCGSTDQDVASKQPDSPTIAATPVNEKVKQRMMNWLLKNVSIDNELYPHVAEFVAYCSSVGGEFTTQCEKRLAALDKVETVDAFEDSPRIVGRCYYGESLSAPRTVQVLKGFVNSNSLSMKGLVFHELGHCLLGQDHVDQNKIDIMTPYIMRESEYGAYWKILVEGLFDSKRLPNEKTNSNLTYLHEDTVE
ncbi:hypothetical protein EBR43_03790, partial [bacterium]|nr:hypothetical protein [bacterium]